MKTQNPPDYYTGQCNDIDECKGISCGLGGTCIEAEGEVVAGKYTCECGKGYEGGGIKTKCVDKNECLDVDCGKDATCVHAVGDPNGDYTCKCAAGWSDGGLNKKCKPVPCPLHSTGVNVSSGCICDAGYSGTIRATKVGPRYYLVNAHLLMSSKITSTGGFDGCKCEGICGLI